MTAAGAAGEERRPSGSRNVEHVRQLRSQLGVADQAAEVTDIREDIRAWRSRTARAAGVPAYVVFTDRTLDALVSQRPSTRDQLARIPGLGPVKVQRYGDDILEMLGTGP